MCNELNNTYVLVIINKAHEHVDKGINRMQLLDGSYHRQRDVALLLLKAGQIHHIKHKISVILKTIVPRGRKRNFFYHKHLFTGEGVLQMSLISF